MTPPFDLTAPWGTLKSLVKKPVFLEASAGSGKTYSLERLVLVFLLEGIPLDRILGVTFTEKSAQDLRTKVRKTLRAAVKGAHRAASGEITPQDWAQSLGLSLSGLPSPQEALPLLKNALGEFSKSHFLTIHGFCQSVLNSFPFESGTPFTQEVKGREWETQVCLDLLRGALPNLDRDRWTALGGTMEDAAETLLKFRDRLWFRDTDPSAQPLPPREDLGALITQVEHFRRELEDPKSPVGQTLAALRNLVVPPLESWLAPGGCRFTQANWLPSSLRALEAVRTFSGGILDFPPLFSKALKRWSTSPKKPLPPEALGGPTGVCWRQAQDLVRRLEAAWEPLAQVLEANDPQNRESDGFGAYQIRQALLLDTAFSLVPELDRRLEDKTRTQGALTFSGMISLVYQGINRPSSPLVQALRERYQAVLIDEFQDTDRLQWGIFRSIFLTPRHRLITVGDAKQGIYGFRGADLQVFQEVRRLLGSPSWGGEILTLPRNYRSGRGLVEGVNFLSRKLFEPDHPQTQGILFEDAQAQAYLGKVVLDQSPPIEVVFLPPEVTRKPQLLDRGVQDAAARILQLHGTLWQSSENPDSRRPLDYGDFALLVLTGKEGLQAQNILTQAGIPATMTGRGALWSSPEAQTLELFFRVLRDPSRKTDLFALGLSPLLDLPLQSLLSAGEDGRLLLVRSWLETQGDLARRGGLLEVFYQTVGSSLLGTWFPEFRPLDQRILPRPGGERSWTNYFHILEILQEKVVNDGLDLDQIPRFLQARRKEVQGEEEINLRLDRDRQAVKILTLHSSKGLEFPVVFLVGVTQEVNTKGQVECLDPFGSKVVRFLVSKGREEKDYLEAERRRLLYVALTRAQARLIFTLPGNPKVKTASWCQDWSPGMFPPENFLVRSALMPESAPPDTTQALPLPLALPPGLPLPSLSPRMISQTSYTSLTKLAPPGDIPRLERLPMLLEKPSTSQSWLETLRGKDFGTFYHRVLQDLDYTGPVDRDWVLQVAQQTLPRRVADTAGLWVEDFLAHLSSLLAHPWTLSSGTTFRFSDLKPGTVWKEKSFTLGTTGNRTPFLGQKIQVPGGYVSGEIDLVFRLGDQLFLLDWKTTTVSEDDQTLEGYRRSMAEHGYMVQLGLYWTALYRMCRTWGGNLKPGGVLYMYLRHDRMIYFQPTDVESDRWDRYFQGESRE